MGQKKSNNQPNDWEEVAVDDWEEVSLGEQPQMTAPPFMAAQPSATAARTFPAHPARPISSGQALAVLGGNIVEGVGSGLGLMASGFGALPAAFLGGAGGNLANQKIQQMAGIKQYPTPEDIISQGGDPFSPESKQSIEEGYVPEINYGDAALAGGVNTAFRGAAAVSKIPSMLKKQAEPLMTHAMNAKFPDLATETRFAKAALEEGIPIRRDYYGSRKAVDEIGGRLQSTGSRLGEEITKTDMAGFQRSTKSIADDATNFLNSKYRKLKGADKTRYQNTLRQLRENFIADNPETMKPSQMQSMKRASQQNSSYGEFESQVAQEWNKSVARQLRTTLESWNPNLAPINKRLGNLSVLSDIYEQHGLKGSKELPAGTGSLPFYIAMSDAGRGFALAASRNILKNPTLLSRAAIRFSGIKAPPALPDALSISELQARSPKLLSGAFTTPVPEMQSGIRSYPPPYGEMNYGTQRFLPPRTSGDVIPPQMPPIESGPVPPLSLQDQITVITDASLRPQRLLPPPRSGQNIPPQSPLPIPQPMSGEPRWGTQSELGRRLPNVSLFEIYKNNGGKMSYKKWVINGKPFKP